MKKIFVSILTLCALAASAQDQETTLSTSSEGSGGSIKDALLENSNKELSFTSKNGQEVLPQKGDWGIGISASNPLTFAQGAFSNANSNSSNLFSSANQSATTQNGAGDITVYGKFFKNSYTAYRGWLSAATDRTVTLGAVGDDGNLEEDGTFLNDKRVQKTRGITLGFGLEKRRGSGRVIGIYGAQVFAGFGHGELTSFDWANEISATNDNPSETSAFASSDIVGTAVGGTATNQRVLKSGSESDILVGAQLFLGVEYFFAPKISLGGEFNFGFNYNPSISSYETVEYFDTNSGDVAEFTRETKDGSSVTSGTGNIGGNINLNFYF